MCRKLDLVNLPFLVCHVMPIFVCLKELALGKNATGMEAKMCDFPM